MENSMLEARHEADAYCRIEGVTGGWRRQNKRPRCTVSGTVIPPRKFSR